VTRLSATGRIGLKTRPNKNRAQYWIWLWWATKQVKHITAGAAKEALRTIAVRYDTDYSAARKKNRTGDC